MYITTIKSAINVGGALSCRERMERSSGPGWHLLTLAQHSMSKMREKHKI